MSEQGRVELVEHSADWAPRAQLEAKRIRAALRDTVLAIHHVGSTAIDGIRAKPVIDLLPVVRSLEALDRAAAELHIFGYQWRGEFGFPGRRYCTLDDPTTGARQVQLHCFADGHPEIERMLIFRDYLREHPAEARAYEAEKERLRRLHPDDRITYSDAKSPWVNALIERARTTRGDPSPTPAE